MNKKICLINQSAGAGDIFFTQKIAKTYIQNGYKIIWPVIPEFSYLNDYMGEENLEFVSTNYTGHFDLYLDLRNSNYKYPSKQIMVSKFLDCKIPHEDWLDYFSFRRNLEREKELFDLLTENKPYVFINKNYGSPPNFAVLNNVESTIENKSLKVVEMDFRHGFTIFDWCTILENAEEIHTVDTSINYIIEKLKLKTDVLNLYPRSGHDTIFQLSGLFKTKWNWII